MKKNPNTLGSVIRAQVEAEVLIRLRSPATLAAVAFFLAASWMWFPPAEGKTATISWETQEGVLQSPETNAAALGLGVALLLSAFFLLAAFYLVVGSLARDRRLGIGQIIAATPTSRGAFLAGRYLAHVAYLTVLSVVAFAVGLAAFVHRGVGSLDLGTFLTPSLLVLPGGLLLVPALALCFETIPFLKTRAGLVLWFLLGVPLLAGAPLAVSGVLTGASPSPPLFDPLGSATLQVLVAQSLPSAVPGSTASGLVIHNTAPIRVPWNGVDVTWGIVGTRVLSAFAISLLPFAIAVLFFDRFDPGKGSRRRPLRDRKGPRPRAVSVVRPTLPQVRYSELTPAKAQPQVWWRAVVADSRLIFLALGRWRFGLLAVALAPILVPTTARPAASALVLLMLALAIADAGNREALFGTQSLVRSQPGVPRYETLWKLGAALVVSLIFALPMVSAAALMSPGRALGIVCGLVTLCAAAVVLGRLTGGTKLFLGIVTLSTYLAVQSFPAADFSGVMGAPLQVPLLYLGAASGLVGFQTWKEGAH